MKKEKREISLRTSSKTWQGLTRQKRGVKSHKTLKNNAIFRAVIFLLLQSKSYFALYVSVKSHRQKFQIVAFELYFE